MAVVSVLGDGEEVHDRPQRSNGFVLTAVVFRQADFQNMKILTKLALATLLVASGFVLVAFRGTC